MSTEETQPRRRREARSNGEIMQLLYAFEQSRIDIKEFCQAHNIGVSTLQKWKSRYSKKEDAAVAQDGFIPLQISPVAAATHTEGLFAEVRGIKIYQPVAASYLKELLQ
jgi:hypothetical protein